jgi:hypothetical protein
VNSTFGERVRCDALSLCTCGVDQLSFPVLCLSGDSSVTAAANPEQLQQCNALAFFKNRYFDDLVIFDSNAEQFRVVRAEAAPPLVGVKKWLTRVFNRHLTVRLELQREAPASIGAAKRQVLIWLEKAADFWEESRDIAEWQEMVEAAPDMRRLLQLFR